MANQKISEYQNTAVDIANSDLYDVSKDLGAGDFESQKISGATLKSELQKIPAGGSVGQVLTKVNATDFNSTWSTPSGGGGNVGKILLIKPGQNSVQYTNFAGVNADA